MRQITPGAAGASLIKNRIPNLAQGIGAGAARAPTFGTRQNSGSSLRLTIESVQPANAITQAIKAPA